MLLPLALQLNGGALLPIQCYAHLATTVVQQTTPADNSSSYISGWLPTPLCDDTSPASLHGPQAGTLTYPRTFPISQQLQAEAHLLGRAFDWLLAVLPLDHHRHTPTFTFAHTDYSQSTHVLLPSRIPDMQALFGSLAPTHPAIYAATCNIQCRSNADFTICLDTGCSMLSTPSLDDFEEPPIKGKFGHLCTINHIVPIEAAGVIRWNVLNSDGQPAVIRVPGYFIPSSGQ